MEQNEKTIRIYELFVLLPGRMLDEEANATLETVRQEIAKRDGVITHDQLWGRRKLAYPIGQEASGVYHLFLVSLSPREAKALDTALRMNQNILRHAIIIYEAKHRPAPMPGQRRMAPRPQAPQAPTTETTTQPQKPALSDEELDKKLDKILEETNINI